MYRPHLEETFTGCNILEKQECYLLGDFDANLLHNGENNLSQKNANIFKTFYSELAGNLVKKLTQPSLKFNSEKN